MEQQFRRALALGEGDLSVFVTRPLTVVILLLALGMLFIPYAMNALRRRSS